MSQTPNCLAYSFISVSISPPFSILNNFIMLKITNLHIFITNQNESIYANLPGTKTLSYPLIVRLSIHFCVNPCLGWSGDKCRAQGRTWVEPGTKAGYKSSLVTLWLQILVAGILRSVLYCPAISPNNGPMWFTANHCWTHIRNEQFRKFAFSTLSEWW